MNYGCACPVSVRVFLVDPLRDRRRSQLSDFETPNDCSSLFIPISRTTLAARLILSEGQQHYRDPRAESQNDTWRPTVQSHPPTSKRLEHRNRALPPRCMREQETEKHRKQITGRVSLKPCPGPGWIHYRINLRPWTKKQICLGLGSRPPASRSPAPL